MSDTPQNPLRAYHARTKHRFDAYAESPGQLDWDAQPAPFRHYPGAPLCELPLSAERFDRAYGQLQQKPENAVAPDIASLGALFELSFAISAWKSWGPNRWALRCNPSSGNLHPVEAWVLTGGLPDVPDGLHHYDPEQHVLEGRALGAPVAQPPWLAIGLSSAMWRETWKYGERAFRYCQLDVGHAIGTLAYAAAVLGWEIHPVPASNERLGQLFGLDRAQDFPATRYPFTESEEPEILFAVHAPGLHEMPTISALHEQLMQAKWQGKASQIDPSPAYRWPIIEQAAIASRVQGDAAATTGKTDFPKLPPLAAHPTPSGAAQLIRQRRSGQRFDPRCTLPRAHFYRMLDAVLPRPELPFSALTTTPRIHLLLFVLRVDGLPCGLYLLPRTPTGSSELSAALKPRFPLQQAVDDCPPHLGLLRLAKLSLPEMQRLARSLSCHQDIASTSAFSLGMLGEFDAATVDGPGYRELLREAGLVGQVLYLEAEAAAVRGTGIGCFFDDPVHQSIGLDDSRWQSVYHFTVGTPIEDKRIETSPPYSRPDCHSHNA